MRLRAAVTFASLASLAGCGAPSSPHPEGVRNTGTVSLTADAAPATDDDACGSQIEDHAAGNHDRYKYEDPATGLTGFKNSAGVVVIKPTYRFAYEFGPGGVAAAVDGTTPFVFIAPSGAVLARAYAFDNGPDYFQEGMARIVDAAGKIGFIDDHGTIAIPPRFDQAEGFCHGRADVVEAGTPFVIDRSGKHL
jgi:hypothetical protein